MFTRSFSRSFTRSRSVLDNAALMQSAPSVFAEHEHSRMSDRYGFIPTINVVDALRGAGWLPVSAQDQRVRLEDRRGFTRHVVRFQHQDAKALANVGDTTPELVLLNSHDGTSAYQMHAGLFRLVCSNGLILADSTFAKISIKHSGDVIGRVIDATAEIVREVPRIAHQVEEMQAVKLTDSERAAFAESALLLRDSTLPVRADQVLRPRRYADNNADLWTTFNVVQENITKGGLSTRNARGGRASTRAVTSINEDTKLNKALWQLAEKMAELKGHKLAA
jgi:hypothetical protein